MNPFDLYKQIIQTMPVHIYWKDINFRYIGCNLLQAQDLGFECVEDLIGKTDFDLLDNASATLIRNNDKDVINSKKPCIFEEPCFSGTKTKVFLTQKIPLFDIKNKIYGIAGISFDITDRKTLEEKIRNEKKQIELTLENIINNLPGHVYWKDKNLTFLGCNIQQAKSAGFDKPTQMIGKSDFDMPWKSDAKKLREIDLSVMNSKSSVTKEETWKSNKTGETLTFLSKKTVLLNQKGEVTGLLGISLDITDRKKMEEEAETANYIMTELIANMGHDLATPISDIGSVAEVLNYYSDEYPDLKDLFKTLAKRSADCEAVRKRIINATAVSNLEVKNESFSIVSELLVLTKELKQLIGSKPLKLVIKPLKPKKEDIIKTDRSKFHEILYDLISNAINFTEKGEIIISVLKQDSKFHIKVSDTGIGIPEDKFEYIFEQYTKLSRSNQYGASFKGIGAGLYLARTRANILHATISVESRLNKGSTFTLSIPYD